jgi:hypothetical protein
MKQTINKYEFAKSFRDMDRHNFSQQGLYVLYEYFEEIDSDYELDVIAICCEYCEATPIEIADMYRIELPNVYGLEADIQDLALMNVVCDWLGCEGALIGKTSNNTIVFQNF